MTRSTNELARRSLFCSVALVVLAILFTSAPLAAQTTTTTTQNPTTSAAGTTPLPSAVFGQTPTSTTTTPTTTTPTTPSTTAPTGTRQPTVVTNQFNTVSGGSISTRAPGRMVEQGLAEATGQLTIPGDATPEPHSFLRQTFDTIAQNLLTAFGNILTGINSFITGLGSTTGGGGSSGTGTTTFVVPPNAATTWSPTLQNIP